MTSHLIATNLTKNVRLTECARVADGILTRVIGLLRDRQLAHGDGLWIIPCNSIHSIGMRFDFDAVFLSKELKVVHLMSEMKPWRVSKMVFSSHSVLEVPAGIIARTGTEIGDQFEMVRDVTS